MEDNLKKNGRQPKKKWKMEDNLKKNKMEYDLNFFWKTRMATSNKMEDDLKKKKMEDDLKKNEMEDNLKK
mgnify:CR=1 FL=1